MGNVSDTVINAIWDSVAHTEIVTLDDEPGLADQLSAYCDNSVKNDGVAEYWGTDDDGNAWRIHIRLP